MIVNEEKIVDFHEYCPQCQYSKLPEKDDPCRECLNTPTNMFSYKPINFKKKEKSK